MENNKQWLAVCCLEIEESLGWGASAAWRNEDFESLAEKILEKTGISLSLSTMKRIWARVRYDNFPTNATLNALVVFINYKDWRNFCEQHPLNTDVITTVVNREDAVLPSVTSANQTAFPLKTTWFVISVFIIAGAIVLLAAQHFTKTKTINHYYNYQFSSRKTSDDLPNSVVFSYDAGAQKDDRVMIQQSWDSSRRELVDPLGHSHTSIYYYPGYFKAKLMVNDSIVKQTPVFIQTKGWKGIAEKKPLPVYFSDKDIRQAAGVAVSSEQFGKALNIHDYNDQWLQFSNMREFAGINADDFIFRVSLRNTSSVEQSLCRNIRVIILGTERPLFIPLTDRGCIADLEVYTGDTVISGKNHDLSALGCDFTFPQSLRCEVKNKMVNLFLNDKKVLSFPQSKSLGDIAGVRIRFEGGGEINSASLSTPGVISYDLMTSR